ncbi:MAG: hypothetical protein Q7R45_15265 [Sulfuricaulis sp.]|nr:hypothetical protein [Sulfuricaulis sp.]
MSTRPEILSQIRQESYHAGPNVALAITRAAIAAGYIDLFDVPDILLALRSGSWRCFEESGRISRGDDYETGRAA